MWDCTKLKVYWRAIDLVEVIKNITLKFPKYEEYETGRQMRRAVSSISYNIGEGSRKRTSKDYVNYLHIALGSVGELETQMRVVDKLRYLEEGEKEKILKELEEIRRILYGIIKFVKKKDVK